MGIKLFSILLAIATCILAVNAVNVAVKCTLPADPGPCLAHIPRFFYNSETGECEKFIYGGCGGNKNNFETRRKCRRQCDPDVVCRLKPRTGRCRGYFERYYHNHKSGRCEMFIYGGCGGNGNNFKSEKKCERVCANGVVDVEDIECEVNCPAGYGCVVDQTTGDHYCTTN